MGIIEIILLIAIGGVLTIYLYEVVHGSIIRHFIIKKKKLTIEERIAKLEAVAKTQETLLTYHDLENIIMKKDLTTCESCGCTVLKDNAMKGESKIHTKYTIALLACHGEEYIYTPYYCKSCYQDCLKKKKEKN